MLVRSSRILILEVVLDVGLGVQNVITHVLGVFNVLGIFNVILGILTVLGILNVILDILDILIIEVLIEVVCCFYNCGISATPSVTYVSRATVCDAVLTLSDYALPADTVADTVTSASATGFTVAI